MAKMTCPPHNLTTQQQPVRETTTVARIKGTVVWFSNAKGYGFLAREGGEDVFVHHTSIVAEGFRSLREGDAVEFDIIEGATGRPQADQVVVIEKSRQFSERGKK